MPIFPQFSPLSPLYPMLSWMSMVPMAPQHGVFSHQDTTMGRNFWRWSRSSSISAVQSANLSEPCKSWSSLQQFGHLCDMSGHFPMFNFLVVHGSLAFWWFWGYVRTDCCSNQSKRYISSTLNWASVCWTNKKRSFSQVSTSWSIICPSFFKVSTFIWLARPGFSKPRVWSSKIWVCLKMRCAQKRCFQAGQCYPVLGQTHMGWTSS